MANNGVAHTENYHKIGRQESIALQHGFNAAIDKLIRGRGAEIFSEMCAK